MEKLYKNEAEKCIQVGKVLLVKFCITSEQNQLPHSLSQKYLVERNKEHKEKKLHCYYYKKLKNDNEIDIKASLAWARE